MALTLTLPPQDGADRYRHALRALRPGLGAAAAISAVISVLMLTGSIYMLQVYDRVLASGYVLAPCSIGHRDFSKDMVVSQLRRAWMLRFIGLTFTLATVHVWTNIYSFVFFVFGAGVWIIMFQPKDAQHSGTEIAEDWPLSPQPLKMTRYSRFHVKERSGAAIKNDGLVNYFNSIQSTRQTGWNWNWNWNYDGRNDQLFQAAPRSPACPQDRGIGQSQAVPDHDYRRGRTTRLLG